ncbi:MAG TPA: histidine phosphatase family protein [Caulobacteraceae bacterium]|jgi:phosphohistidine phosphatase
MRRLILFRHAKTEARSQAGDDFSRRLTDRGGSEAALMGEVLSQAGYQPDLVLVSPAARAVETWDGMAASFPKARVERRKALYDATPEEIAEETEHDTSAADTVMVVGHNPGLQELAVNLLIDNAGSHHDIEVLSAGFPTSAAAVFVYDEAGRASLEAVHFARDHRPDR